MDQDICACPLFPCMKCRTEVKNKQAFLRRLLSKSDEEHAYDNRVETDWACSKAYWIRQEAYNNYNDTICNNKTDYNTDTTRSVVPKTQLREMSPSKV